MLACLALSHASPESAAASLSSTEQGTNCLEMGRLSKGKPFFQNIHIHLAYNIYIFKQKAQALC